MPGLHWTGWNSCCAGCRGTLRITPAQIWRRCDGEGASRGAHFASAIDVIGVEIDRWDLGTLGASFIVYDEPGTSKLITSVDAALWR